jgi:hypothetical protein
MRISIAVTLCVVLAGCVVPYARKGTEGFMGGYEDKKLGPDHYAIEIEGNGYTKYELAEEYFHRRAKELCGGRPYTHKWERTTTQHTNYYFTGRFGGATQHVFPVVVGEIKCEPS